MSSVPIQDNLYSLDRLEWAAQHVYKFMEPTPQQHWPSLSARCGCEVWVKHENLCPTGAFKVRGGMVYFETLQSQVATMHAVVTATRGNHGQSIGMAARAHQIPATVFVPEGNSVAKNKAMEALGVNLYISGADFADSIENAKAYALETDAHFIPSFHSALVQGVASYSLEFLRAVPELDAVYVPIGLGSGICGMIAARNALGLKTQIIGVVAENAPVYALSFAQGKPLSTDSAVSVADGVACRTANPEALAMMQGQISRIVMVPEEGILQAMAILHTDTGHTAEGAGAIALAALIQEKEKMVGQRVGIILSGGNVDEAVLRCALEAC